MSAMPRNPNLDRREPLYCIICKGRFFLDDVGRPRKICKNPDCARIHRARQTQRRRKAQART